MAVSGGGGGAGGFWPRLQVPCVVRRGVEAPQGAIPAPPGVGGADWDPGLGVRGLHVAVHRARARGSRVRGSLGKRLRDAGKAMGKECCRAGTLGGWRVRAACRAEINRRAPPTPTSRSLAGHWRLSLAREGGRVGGKASKPVQLFRARGVPGRQGALGRVQSLQHWS